MKSYTAYACSMGMESRKLEASVVCGVYLAIIKDRSFINGRTVMWSTNFILNLIIVGLSSFVAVLSALKRQNDRSPDSNIYVKFF